MLPITVRARLFNYSFQVRGHGLMEVPLLTWTDLAVIPRVGLREFGEFVIRFRHYRRQLDRPDWSCITSFYPRANYLLYYYLLFWWAEYCCVISTLLAEPDWTLIPEVFFRYIIEIDKIIDGPGGKQMLANPRSIKRNPSARSYLSLLIRLIKASGLSQHQRHALFHTMSAYRRGCLHVCQQSASNKSQHLPAVLDEKKHTAAGLYGMWARMLGILYLDVAESDYSRSAPSVLANTCMAMQVIDDLIDLPLDMAAGTSNIIYALLQDEPAELAEVKRYCRLYPWAHLDGKWAEQNLVQTYDKALRLIDHYLHKAQTVSVNPVLTGRLCGLIRSLPSYMTDV